MYHPVRNRLVRETDGSLTTFTYDAANQLVKGEPSTGGAGQTDYSYDKAGNLTGVFEGTGNPQTRGYTWDDDNRLRVVTPAISPPTTMTYNADGLRVQVASPTETLNKIWDFQTMIAEAEDTNAIRRYAHKPGLYGDVLHKTGTSPSRFYLADALGSTIGLTDDSRDVSDSYLYKAYGEVLAESGSAVNPFQWVGQFGYQYDKITNDILQQYIRQRHYGPEWAVWLSADPLPGHLDRLSAVPVVASPELLSEIDLLTLDPTRLFLERYSYSLDNPITLIDPSGLATAGVLPGVGVCVGLPQVCAAVGIIAGIVVIGGIVYYLVTPAAEACLDYCDCYCQDFGRPGRPWRFVRRIRRIACYGLGCLCRGEWN